jgi:hypothetical protein
MLQSKNYMRKYSLICEIALEYHQSVQRQERRADLAPTRFDVLMSDILVWDIETILDLKGFATANRHVGNVLTMRAPYR